MASPLLYIVLPIFSIRAGCITATLLCHTCKYPNGTTSRQPSSITLLAIASFEGISTQLLGHAHWLFTLWVTLIVSDLLTWVVGHEEYSAAPSVTFTFHFSFLRQSQFQKNLAATHLHHVLHSPGLNVALTVYLRPRSLDAPCTRARLERRVD
jgi:hypothetical protein